MPDRLTPEGAKMLRFVRDYVVAHPLQLEMNTWECGTSACIAGHCARYLFGTVDASPKVRKRTWECSFSVSAVLQTLGFESAPSIFYQNYENDINKFVESINKFLWFYGYPPEEVPESRQAQAEAQVQEGLATPLQA